MPIGSTRLETAFLWEAQHVPVGARKMRGTVRRDVLHVDISVLSSDEAPVGFVHNDVPAHFSEHHGVATEGSLSGQGRMRGRKDADLIRVLADGRSFIAVASVDAFGPEALALNPHDMTQLKGMEAEIPTSRRFEAASLGMGGCVFAEKAVRAKAATWFVCDGLVFAPCVPPVGFATDKGYVRLANHGMASISGRVVDVFWGSDIDGRSKPVASGMTMNRSPGVLRQPWYDAGPGQRIAQSVLGEMNFHANYDETSLRLALELIDAAGLSKYDADGLPTTRLAEYDAESCHRVVKRLRDRARPLGQDPSKTPSLIEIALDRELMLVPVLSPVPTASIEDDASFSYGM